MIDKVKIWTRKFNEYFGHYEPHVPTVKEVLQERIQKRQEQRLLEEELAEERKKPRYRCCVKHKNGESFYTDPFEPEIRRSHKGDMVRTSKYFAEHQAYLTTEKLEAIKVVNNRFIPSRQVMWVDVEQLPFPPIFIDDGTSEFKPSHQGATGVMGFTSLIGDNIKCVTVTPIEENKCTCPKMDPLQAIGLPTFESVSYYCPLHGR